MTTAMVRHFSRRELAEITNLLVGEKVSGGVDQLITTVTAAQNYELGAKKMLGQSVYRYGLAGAAILALGELCQAPVPPATETGLVPDAVYLAGTRVITVTTGAAVGENEFAGGWMHVETGIGEGQSFRIISHPATVGVALCAFTLLDPVTTDLDLTSRTGLTANPYNLAIVHDSPPTAQLVGVPVAAIAAGEYGWFQTRGPAAVLTDGVLYIYQQVVPSDGVDGAVRHAVQEVNLGAAIGAVATDSALVVASDGGNSAVAAASILGSGAAAPTAGPHDFGSLLTIVGRVMRVEATTEYSLIFLTLE